MSTRLVAREQFSQPILALLGSLFIASSDAAADPLLEQHESSSLTRIFADQVRAAVLRADELVAHDKA